MTATAPRERINLLALIAGIGAGLGSFAFLISAGYVLYQRLFGSGMLPLIGILTVFTLIGGYAGWLLGLIAFSVVRGPVEGAD